MAQFVTVIATYGFVYLLAPTLPSSLTQTISNQVISTITSLAEVKFVPSCSGFTAGTINSTTGVSSFSMVLACS